MIKVKLTKQEYRMIQGALNYLGNKLLREMEELVKQDKELSKTQTVKLACKYYELSRKVKQAKK